MRTSTIKYYLDTRRPLKGGAYPLKLVVYHYTQCYIKTQFNFSREQWAVLQDRTIRKSPLFSPNNNINDSELVIAGIRKELDDMIHSAEETLKALKKKGSPFNASDVRERMTGTKFDKSHLQYLYNCHLQYIAERNNSSSYKTVSGYSSIIAVLKEYYESLSKRNKIESLRFIQIDYAFLRAYKEYLLKKGDSLATVSAHNRYIKALFNYAITKDAITKEIYPYGKDSNHFTIQTVKNTKKALTTDELVKLINYRPKLLERQRRNFDLALLSFMLNGANMLDIAQWTYKKNYNAGAKSIHFYREKTVNKNTSITEIVIPVSKEIKQMMDLYGNPKSPDNYIFNILRPSDDTPEKVRKRVHDTTRAIDKTLKRIAKQCGIREDISFIFFRHTHATFLVSKGANLYDIMVSMGHKDIQTTARYVDSLPSDNSSFAKQKHELLKGVYGKDSN